jgi:hypothetical protein
LAIKDRIDPRIVFQHASRFHYGTGVLRLDIQQTTIAYHLQSYIMLSAFTSELYLKCLHALERGGSRLRTHDLCGIFEQLSDETRAFCVGEWDKVTAYYTGRLFLLNGQQLKMPDDLRTELAATGKIFQDIRYFYEGTESARHWYLSPLPDILRSRILDLRPEWKDESFLMQMDSTSDESLDYTFAAYGLAPFPPEEPNLTPPST